MVAEGLSDGADCLGEFTRYDPESVSAARQLARSGASVVVLDGERVGWGASSRNGGQVLTGMKLDPGTLVARFGEARARDLFGASLESIAGLERIISDEGMACEYVVPSKWMTASKPYGEGFAPL